jgi:outer membrane immunogenic protein
MKKQMLGMAMFAGLLMASAAQAADMPLKAAPYAPVYSWTGWYIGAHIGGAWSDNRFVLREPDDPAEGSTEHGRNRSSVFGGGQIGYNFQSGSWLFGGEVDLGSMNPRSTVEFRNDPGDFASIRGGFYGDITARLGYVSGPWLFYAKGGAAFLDTRFRANEETVGVFSASKTTWGWAAGAGIEYMIAPAWSIKVEYLHFDFGRTTLATDPPDTVRFEPGADTVKFGVNYRFGGGYR